MNPPFKSAAEFVAHALELVPLVAALLRIQFSKAAPADNGSIDYGAASSTRFRPPGCTSFAIDCR
jgi:hypothetical protein